MKELIFDNDSCQAEIELLKQINIIRNTLVPGNTYIVENEQRRRLQLLTYVAVDYHPSTYHNSSLMIADTIMFRTDDGRYYYLPLQTKIYDNQAIVEQILHGEVEPLLNNLDELMSYIDKSTSTITAFYNELKIGDSYSIMVNDNYIHEKNVIFKGFVNNDNEKKAVPILIVDHAHIEYPLYYNSVFSTHDNKNISLNIFTSNIRVRVYHTIIKAKTHAALSMRKHGIPNELFRHAESFLGGQSRRHRNIKRNKSIKSKRNKRHH